MMTMTTKVELRARAARQARAKNNCLINFCIINENISFWHVQGVLNSKVRYIPDFTK